MKEYLKQFQKQANLITADKKSAVDFLVEAGILTKKGKLKKKYCYKI